MHGPTSPCRRPWADQPDDPEKLKRLRQHKVEQLAAAVVAAAAGTTGTKLGFCGVMKGHSEMVTWAQFSPDGEKIVSASNDNTVRVWSAETGECEQTLEGHNEPVT